MKAAVFLGHAQADGVTSVMLRSRSRDYANHHVTLEKHPHTGRVLWTVRLAFAASALGMLWRSRASASSLDALFCPNGRTRTPKRIPHPLPWPSEGDRWLHAGSPVNLLRCEE